MSLKKDIIEGEVRLGSNEAQKSLTDLTQKTAKLTNENDRLRISQAKLKALGKENTEEYKKITKAISDNNTEIKNNRSQMDALRKTMGLNELSAKQLRARITELRRELNNMNQSADPETWKKRNAELIAAQKQYSKLQGSIGQTKGTLSSLTAAAKTLLPALGLAAIITGFKSLVSNIISVRQEFEKYEAVLKNSLGSQREARKEMRMLTEFAAETPFQLSELTGAFVKLTNYGLKPSREEMRKYGDIAASVGKSFDQWAEAVADAITGENERLKEFGIRASKHGDTISYTFRGITTEVKNNSEAIKNYLVSLGDVEGVSGSMAAISETLGGKLSNLSDAWDSLMNNMGSRSSGIMFTVIGWLNDLVSLSAQAAKSVEQIVQEAMDDQQTEATKNAIEEINNLTNSYIKNGLGRVDAEKKARETYISSLEDQMNYAREMKNVLIGVDKEAMNDRLTNLSLEYVGVVEHYKKLDELASVKAAEEKQKREKDASEAAAKLKEKLEEFWAKDSESQQDAITEYFRNAGEKAFDEFMNALERKRQGVEVPLSLVTQEDEKGDPALDYAVQQYKESLDYKQLLLQTQYDNGLIGEQEYQDRLNELNKQGEEERYNQKQQYADKAKQLSTFGLNFVTALMNLELEKAGDNEEKKKEIRKKYATIQFMTTASQIVVDTASAIIKALAVLGPIAGPIAAGFIGATGAVQLATAYAEMNKVKSLAVGGYTGDGGKYEPAGIVHKGEYVIPQEGVNNPNVRQIIDVMELARKNGSLARLDLRPVVASVASNQQGFAAGGSTSSVSTTNNTIYQSDPELKALLTKLTKQLDKPIKASVNKYGTDSVEEAIQDITKFNSKVSHK